MHRATICLVLLLSLARETLSQPSWVSAAAEVMDRLIPSHSKNFAFVAVNASASNFPLPGLSNDQFVVEASNGIVTVYGTSGVALTSGAYWYLKNVAKCQVTWGVNGTGDQLNLPAVLPSIARLVVNASVPLRYGWNMCTFSYSAPWWDQTRWQREIDWMALHGVNFPLALTGQEYLWVQVFANHGIGLDQLESWFTGPAFLAWQRAGNIRGFAGPLTWHWIVDQMNLQKFILGQMRALGMTPILPCFAGHVPEVARTVWPQANFTKSASWNGFPDNETDVWYLDPTDPLFTQLGKEFMDAVIATFGTNHYYSCDTFNEVDPKSTEYSYLKAASAAVHNAIAAADEGGIWVMQAWLFHSSYWNFGLVQAYLSGVSNHSMVILDLNSEAGVLAPLYDQYFGKPWVWNMLHNYGGVRGVYGNLTTIATGPYVSLYTPNSTMLGIGFTPEAIEQNPVMYEMLTSTFWSSQPIDVQTWLKAYVEQRYGTDDPSAWAAWQALFNAVYNQPGEPRSEIEWVPHWEIDSFGWQNGNATGMFEAFKLFLTAAKTIPNATTTNGPFMYDFVDVTRQAATMFFSDAHRELSNTGYMMTNRASGNITGSLSQVGALLLNIISTLDDLLGTNPNYLLGVWVNDALANGLANESSLYMYNAKNQLTLWGPTAQICDYAAKAWNGLYGDYYLRRWTYMTQLLVSTSTSGGWWNSFKYEENLLATEIAWCSNSTNYPATPPTKKPLLDIAESILGLISATPAVKAKFTRMENMDSIGGDVTFTPTWTTDISQLMQLCDAMPVCEGFTSTGYLKTSIQSPTPHQGSDLYVKQGLNMNRSKKPHDEPLLRPPVEQRRRHMSVGNQKSKLFGGGVMKRLPDTR